MNQVTDENRPQTLTENVTVGRKEHILMTIVTTIGLTIAGSGYLIYFMINKANSR